MYQDVMSKSLDWLKKYNPILWLAIGLVRFYQLFISPLLGPRCRFYPSCSQYAIDALHEKGVIVGLIYASKRLIRCHPGSKGGIDFINQSTKRGSHGS